MTDDCPRPADPHRRGAGAPGPARRPPRPDFDRARLFRYDVARERFIAAPDYALGPGPAGRGGAAEGPLRREPVALRPRPAGQPRPACGARAGPARARWPRPRSWRRSRTTPGLRMVELDRDEIAALPRLFESLRGRPERFVVLCDDLSFEEGAAAAKSLKSALEGGVAGPPENVLFVATSNRRHLMPRGHDEGRGLIAVSEDAEEEVSVSDRFGLWIGFPPMDQAVVPGSGPRLCGALRPGGSRPRPPRPAMGPTARRPLRPGRLAIHPRPGRGTGQAAAFVKILPPCGGRENKRPPRLPPAA